MDAEQKQTRMERTVLGRINSSEFHVALEKVGCSSYRLGGKPCADGFPIGYPASSACTGSKCACGGPSNKILPNCQNEDLGPAWLDESGLPKMAEWRKTESKPA